MEFCGDGVAALSMDDRLCIANMAIEAGAKNGIFPVDDMTRAYVDGRVNRPYTAYEADPDAEYDRRPSRSTSARSSPPWPSPICRKTPTPSPRWAMIDDRPGGHRLLHQRPAGRHGRGRRRSSRASKVADGVRCIVIPATQHIYKECIEKGYLHTFIDAGCAVSTPTCGPCLGGHMGVLADGRAVRVHHQPQLRGPHGPRHVARSTWPAPLWRPPPPWPATSPTRAN